MHNSSIEITRSEFIAMIEQAAEDARLPHVKQSALSGVAETARRVAVGNFTPVGGVACPWTAAGLDSEAAGSREFAKNFDSLADAALNARGIDFEPFYDLVVVDA